MDDGSNPIICLVIFFALLVITAVLYGFSSAIQNISLKTLEDYDEKSKGKERKLEHIINNPDRFIYTVHVVTMFMSVFVGVYVVRNIIMAILFIVCMLTFGIIVPKKLGRIYSERWAFSLYNFVHIIMTILIPVTFIIKIIVNFILIILGIDIKAIEDVVTEEDIVSMVNEGHEQGVLLDSEAEMITNIVEFSDKEVKDIMKHRTNLVALDGSRNLSDTIRNMLSENYSRFPVYDGNIDNIVGIIHLKDAMIIREEGNHNDWRIIDIPDLIREVEFIPETRNINTVFKDMQYKKIHMQVVLDEYGQTSGIIAMEDIIEEIVGNIQDEYDDEEENIIEKEDNIYIVNGLTTLLELNDVLGLDIENEDYDTINGYLIAKLERIPGDDELPDICIDNIEYQILEVKNKMISKIQIKMPVSEIEDETKEIDENNE